MQPALNFYDIVFCLLPHNNTAILSIFEHLRKKREFLSLSGMSGGRLSLWSAASL